MEELKTCPFCGGGYIDSKDAVTAWNTRPDNWISVEDRLPISREMVLTCSEFGEIAMEYYCKTLNGFTDRAIPDKQDINYGITHWQPLPEPPKGVE